MEISQELAELEAKRKELIQKDREERERIRSENPPIMQFTLFPSERPYDVSYDDSCTFYVLNAECVNKEESIAIGHPEFMTAGGGMVYVWNSLSGKLVCPVGGGSIWVSDGYTKKNKRSAKATFELLSRFLRENPAGGDVTDIVNQHRLVSE